MFKMETITLHKFSHEEYWTQEYEKFNTLPRCNDNANLFNVGTKDNIELVLYKFKKQHTNLKVEEWKKLCFSPNVHTILKRVTVVVEKMVKNGVTKKVRISRYFTIKGRKCGAKYFWKNREVVHITFDLVNNNLYKTTTNYYGRKKNTTIMKNPFKYWKKEHFNLKEIEFDLDLSQTIVLNNLNKFIDNPNYWEKKDKLNSELHKCRRTLTTELSSKDVRFNMELNKNQKILDIASVWFSKVRGIKTPNKWMYYFINNYPGIRLLKKKGNNLIQTILKENGIYSKYAVKLFNTYKNIKVESYQMMLEALGIHLLRELNPILLTEKYSMGWQLNLELTTQEKKNFVHILNSLLDQNNEPSSVLSEVNMVISDIVTDHLGRLKPRLKREGVDVKLKAKNYEEFVEEHLRWTTLVDEINNTTNITHIYKKDFLMYIQQPIIINELKITPKVLRDTYEYRDESKIQHNCVKTYIEHKDPCIISLRDENGNRITNEFIPQGESKIMTNIQSRAKYNSSVVGDLQPFVIVLNLRMKRASIEKIYGKTQVIKECVTTGKCGELKKVGRRRGWEDLPF